MMTSKGSLSLALCAGAAVSASAIAAPTELPLDISGAETHAYIGDPSNEVRTYDLAAMLGLDPGTPVVIRSVGWDATLTTDPEAWASTSYILLRNGDGEQVGVQVRPAGMTFEPVTEERFESDGMIDLVDTGGFLHPSVTGGQDVYLPDGVLVLEFYDLFDSVPGADSVWEAPSEFVVAAEGTGEFASLADLSVQTLEDGDSVSADTSGATNNLDLGGLLLPGGRYDGGDHVYTIDWAGGVAEFMVDVTSGDHGLAVYNSAGDLIDVRDRGGDDRLVLSLGAGTYYVVVDSRSEDEGAYTFSVQEFVSPSLASMSIGTLEVGVPTEGDNTDAQDDIDYVLLRPGSLGYWYGGDDVWTLEWPGGSLELTATSETGDPDIALFAGGYPNITSGGMIGDDSAYAIDLPAGTYHVTVDAYTFEDEGPYTLQASQVEFLVTGEVHYDGPTYHEPAEDGSELSPWGADSPYEALGFTVDTTGLYDITTIYQVFDGLLVIYEGSFDPESPLTNFLAADDRWTDLLHNSRVEDVLLEAGTEYVLVVSGVNDISGLGKFGVWADGPGELTFTDLDCRADLSGDGTTTVADLLEYLNLFRAQDEQADFTDDGQINVQDLLAYLGEFRAGC